jgi:hypothetical protein
MTEEETKDPMNKRKLLANSAAVGLVSMLPSRAIDARLASPSATGSGSSGVIDQLRAEHNSLTPPKRGSIPVAFPITHGAVIIDFAGLGRSSIPQTYQAVAEKSFKPTPWLSRLSPLQQAGA